MYSEKGQSLMELVVVIAVMVVVIGALTFATIASLRNAQFSKNQAQATKLAQEGLEWVRTGRDRNSCIKGLSTPPDSEYSWNGNSSDPNCAGEGSIWNYRISGDCAKEELDISTRCYFIISSAGVLRLIAFDAENFPTSSAESIPPPPATPVFRRVVTLSDDSSFACAKKVTSIVQWKDFSGDHSSTLTTILRNVSCK